MASRFAALSPWRNLAAKPLPSYSEVPVAPSEAGRAIALVEDSLVIARGTTPGTLVILKVGDDHAGKYGNKVETVNLPASAADLEAAPFTGGHVAVGREDGTISLLSRSDASALPAADKERKHPEANGPVLVRWHPHARLLLTAAPSSAVICVWSMQKGEIEEPSLSIKVEVGSKAGGKFVHDLAWSTDGKKVYAALADGTVKLYDPRQPDKAALSSTPAPFGVPKPMRLAVTSKYVLASTLNPSRQRELRVYAASDLSRSLQVITLDTASHPLTLTVDYDRNLVFLGSKGDVTLRWIELDDNQKFPQGAFPLPPRTTFGNAALLPPTGLDVMQAEINRLYVLSSSGEVVPVRIEIPQRQLIDFHPHLYPDTAAGAPALEPQQWLEGHDGQLRKVSVDPARRSEWIAVRGSQHGIPSAGPPSAGETGRRADQSNDALPNGRSEVQAAASAPPTNGPNSNVSSGDPTIATSEVPAAAQEATSRPEAPAATSVKPSSLPPPTRLASNTEASRSPPASSTQPIATPTKTVSSKPLGTPSTSSWSRTTLTGSTPLLPAFSSIPAFDTSTSPSARAFLVTPLHLLYPLSGAGGRLAFHQVMREGRLPEAQAISWVETANNIADFEADIFNPRRVATIGEDGLKMWLLPEAPRLQAGQAVSKPTDEYSQTIVSSPTFTLPLPDLGRGCKVSFNPIASDVLVVAGADGLAILDTAAAEAKILSELAAGVAEAEWSLDGSLIAFARSDRRLVLWDPRTQVQAEIAAHDSSRPFKICWIDEEHLVTVGHMAGSTRQVKLFKLSRGPDSITISEKGRLALDTSPAILFPHYDADAQLLYLWSKGERSISVLQVSLDPPKPKFGVAAPLFKALPAFQHSTPQLGISFLPKRYCDVKAVEVGLSYRLSRTQEIQIVSWKVERKRKDFFQDDVFPATRDVETPVVSASEWWSERAPVKMSELPHIDLHPIGMTPLSQAPPPETTVSSLAKAPTQRMMTAKERDDELMNNVFSKAKDRDAEEEMEDTAARKRAPADDDWGDD
ncbi:DUF1900-domain-containing protein [Microstroma glucosiphilum]|uniref:DUF1900-domain-containing protein n=1 Tax=Pseudomicrostroma glucosiphilum TaxID=1684307 RepID=A0A316UEJ4_9BASI|nr:DUF1900-domain-containing protein [Pseudomicrostroma glucosiphilum]PWN23707.1 DUF1900-domain-containing protein [Pseudomicrostroma glucosiphilum]